MPTTITSATCTFSPRLASTSGKTWPQGSLLGDVIGVPDGEEFLPGVQVLATPGHTRNHGSLLVDQEIALAGDAIVDVCPAEWRGSLLVARLHPRPVGAVPRR